MSYLTHTRHGQKLVYSYQLVVTRRVLSSWAAGVGPDPLEIATFRLEVLIYQYLKSPRFLEKPRLFIGFYIGRHSDLPRLYTEHL